MARPKNCREIGDSPGAYYYKPKGVPYSSLEEVVVTLDEFEALRLADHEGLYQQDAAERMGISRQTFGRIVDSAHRKIAEALVNGRALRIEGGDVRQRSSISAMCASCNRSFSYEKNGEEKVLCPRCGTDSAED